MKELTSFEQEFVDVAGELAMKISYARSVGQIFGLLYIHPGALSLDDIVEKLRLSKGSVSTNLRDLEEWGAIQKVFVRGSRRTHYAAEKDLAALALRRIEGGLRTQLSWAKGRHQDLEGRLGAAKGAEASSAQARLRQLIVFTDRVERVLNHLPKLRPLLKLAGGGK